MQNHVRLRELYFLKCFRWSRRIPLHTDWWSFGHWDLHWYCKFFILSLSECKDIILGCGTCELGQIEKDDVEDDFGDFRMLEEEEEEGLSVDYVVCTSCMDGLFLFTEKIDSVIRSYCVTNCQRLSPEYIENYSTHKCDCTNFNPLLKRNKNFRSRTILHSRKHSRRVHRYSRL